MEETVVGVGVDLETDKLQSEAAQAAATFQKIAGAVQGMVERLDLAVTTAKRLGDQFEVAFMKATKVQGIARERAQIQAGRGADAIERNRIMNQASPNGGTLADDNLRKFALGAYQTAINTSADQITAQLRETGFKATTRMMKTTSDAMTAAINSVSFTIDQNVKTFNDRAALHARTVQADARRIQTTQTYGPFASGAEFVLSQTEKARQDQLLSSVGRQAAMQRSSQALEEKQFNDRVSFLKWQSDLQRNSALLEQRQADERLATVGRQATLQRNSAVLEERQLNERLSAVGRQATLQRNSERLEQQQQNERLSAVGRQAALQKASEQVEERLARERMRDAVQSAGAIRNLEKIKYNAEFETLREVTEARKLSLIHI